MAMHLPHPLLSTQNMEIKEHEAFGWKIGNEDRRGRIKKYIQLNSQFCLESCSVNEAGYSVGQSLKTIYSLEGCSLFAHWKIWYINSLELPLPTPSHPQKRRQIYQRLSHSK